MRITTAQRRARIGRRHLLAQAARVDTPEQVARGLVALHGTDPSTVYLSLWSRMRSGDVPCVERALYTDRTMVRLLAMRRTVFVVPVELAAVVLAASSRGVAAQQRRLLLALLADADLPGDPDGWLAETEAVALAALRQQGSATATDLAAADPRLRTELVLAKGKPYEGRQRVISRVLLVLAAQGLVVRGRPLGSWTSTQFRWSPAEAWLPGGFPELSTEDAQVELARHWLGAFGPATVADLRWWTGWTLTQTRRALSRLDLAEVDLDGAPGVALSTDLEPEPEPDPWVALLPALDPTPMGWTERDFYLGPHGPQLFDRTGNVSPTVWADGRIVGGWAQRKDGEVVVRLLEDVGSDTRAAITQAAGTRAAQLGPTRLTARARTASPVERELLR
ncbi:winged helix DNA-binding domain-containing protein [Actinophytocola sp.]|uniref:winged helix DNA-binding domain-containing protein n=1 Tax=Actinophytocola sp. TaxID=1872138 RepID=UPI002D7FD727|nr:winged helix DNA-binding domain-containing protein [Actinophytocola sp.]HET9141469.1 winged helix DNA-binding domain-containing protein [Actinophytocola sp.]